MPSSSSAAAAGVAAVAAAAAVAAYLGASWPADAAFLAPPPPGTAPPPPAPGAASPRPPEPQLGGAVCRWRKWAARPPGGPPSRGESRPDRADSAPSGLGAAPASQGRRRRPDPGCSRAARAGWWSPAGRFGPPWPACHRRQRLQVRSGAWPACRCRRSRTWREPPPSCSKGCRPGPRRAAAGPRAGTARCGRS